MQPAIREGSFIVAVRIVGELKLGDVVVFEREGRLLVKRIAALAGDTVVISGEMVPVPDGYYFMLGDNLEASIDSRSWAESFIEKSRIIALLPFH